MAAALLAVLLSAPSLGTGWHLDDFMWRSISLDPLDTLPPGIGRLDMFMMSLDDPATIRHHRDRGFAPWWTPDDFKLGFWRPLAAAHHVLQFRLWPDSPLPMHAVSLFWLGVTTFLAGLFYRRFIATAWIAGLAAVLYAMQPGHAMTAAWVANQHALLGVSLGLTSILTHDAWRVKHWRPGVAVSPLLFGATLLCGESGTMAGAYLLAYAVFMDPIRMTPRALGFIAPHFIIGLLWFATYRMGGYGVDGSGGYIDPIAQPGLFAWAALERVPILLGAIWFLFPATMLSFVSRNGWIFFSGVLGVLVLILAVAMGIALRRKSSSQFLVFSLALALLPIAATLPSDRNLMWAGVAATGLLAQWIGAMALKAGRNRLPDGETVIKSGGRSRSFRPPVAAAGLLLYAHLIFGPLGSLGNARGFAAFDPITRKGYEGILQEPEVRDQMAIFVNPPASFVTSFFEVYRRSTGEPVPASFRVLTSGVYPLKLKRIDERTVALRAEAGGFLQPMGRWDVPGQPRDPWFNINYLTQLMDRVFRSGDRPFTRGETTVTEGMTAEVVELAPGGGVREVRFTFEVPLEDASLRWLKWEGHGYKEFVPPKVGEVTELPALDLMELLRP